MPSRRRSAGKEEELRVLPAVTGKAEFLLSITVIEEDETSIFAVAIEKEKDLCHSVALPPWKISFSLLQTPSRKGKSALPYNFSGQSAPSVTIGQAPPLRCRCQEGKRRSASRPLLSATATDKREALCQISTGVEEGGDPPLGLCCRS